MNKIPLITKSKFELNDGLDRTIEPTILFKNRINKILSIRSTNLNIPSINQPNVQRNNNDNIIRNNDDDFENQMKIAILESKKEEEKKKNSI